MFSMGDDKLDLLHKYEFGACCLKLDDIINRGIATVTTAANTWSN